MSTPIVTVGAPESKAQQDNSPIDAAAMRAAQATVTDARGRVIAVKRLNALQRMRLVKVLGADGASNSTYLAYATLAASVLSIDGNALAPAFSKLVDVEARVQLLDDEGLDAVAKALRRLEPDEADVGETAKKLIEGGALKALAWLIYNGFTTPPDLLLSLDDAEILAFSVCFGEFQGGEFDWGRMRWVEKKD